LEQYKTFTAEQFLNDPAFRDWLHSPSDESELFWREFLERYPEKQKAVKSARSMYLALRQLQELPNDEQVEVSWQKIQDEIEADSTVFSDEIPASTPNSWRYWMAAASVLFLLSIGGLYLWKNYGRSTADTYGGQVARQSGELVEIVNRGKKIEEVQLPDGSTVQVYPSGRISHKALFSEDQRVVFLSGKAFFEVVKDPKRPFLVYANGLVTQVVGTSFLINSPSSTVRATVEVFSGKVNIFTLENFEKTERGEAGDVTLLLPNQQITYDPAKAVITRQVTKAPRLLNAPEAYPNFYFENTSVIDVFKTLEDSYGVTIRYDARTIEECSVTAPLGSEPLFRKLDIICQTIGATYEVWGTEIIVKGNGCGN
jgi:ferric-dicitrate binding protein FerR (iron transport regulator)